MERLFFNEAEVVAAEEASEDSEAASRWKPEKKQGKQEEDLEEVSVAVVELSMMEEEMEALFGKESGKRLLDEVYRRYGFIPAKVEVEEYHVKVYAGKRRMRS